MSEEHLLKRVVVCFPGEIAFDLCHGQQHCPAKFPFRNRILKPCFWNLKTQKGKKESKFQSSWFCNLSQRKIWIVIFRLPKILCPESDWHPRFQGKIWSPLPLTSSLAMNLRFIGVSAMTDVTEINLKTQLNLYTLLSLAKIMNTDHTACWGTHGKSGPLIDCWWDYTEVWQFLKKMNISNAIYPSR